jgi:hypothetical protein
MAKQKASPPVSRRRVGGAGLLRWAVRVASSILLWTALLQLSTFFGLPRLPLRAARPSCPGNRNGSATASAVASDEVVGLAPPAPPTRSELFLSSRSRRTAYSWFLGLGSWNPALLATVFVQRSFLLQGRGSRNVASYSIHELDRIVYGELYERAQSILRHFWCGSLIWWHWNVRRFRVSEFLSPQLHSSSWIVPVLVS